MDMTAVVTGATSGIGAAYARRLAADGFDLILTGRRVEIIHKLADDLMQKHGIKANVIIAELSEDNDINKVIEAVRDAGNVSILINNAGYGHGARNFTDMEPESIEKMIKTHQTAPVKLIDAVLPGMVERGEGTIINVSSGMAFLTTPNQSLYCSTKAFLKTFTESLYMELKEKGIKVQVLCPGYTLTDFWRDNPEGRPEIPRFMWMTPDAVVDYSLKCVKKNRQAVCIPGIINRLGISFLPLIPGPLYYKLVDKFTYS